MFSDEILAQVKALNDRKVPSSTIARELAMNHWDVMDCIEELENRETAARKARADVSRDESIARGRQERARAAQVGWDQKRSLGVGKPSAAIEESMKNLESLDPKVGDGEE